MTKHAPEIASLFPQASALVEFGSGSSRKARILLRAAASVEAYVPVDISGDFLREDAARLRRDFPHLADHPVVADFTAMAELPGEIAAMPRAGFFPGSTIGNFEPHEACAFLRRAGGILGAGSVLIVGIDLEKAPDILYRAYNDAEGVTAKFNLNLLVRINRELGGNFDLAAFEHHAFYNCRTAPDRNAPRQHQAAEGRGLAMRPSNSAPARRSIPRTATNIRSNLFRRWRSGSGWSPLKVWTDGLFSVHALRMTQD